MTLSLGGLAVNRLNTHSFETIWNGSPGEYTVNIAMAPITPNGAIGAVIFAQSAYSLPDGNPYMVYTVPYGAFANSELLPSDSWITSAAVLADVQTLLTVTTDLGITFPRNSVYLYKPSASQSCMVALRSNIWNKFFPGTVPNFYISAYRNPIITAPILTWSYQMPTPITVGAIATMQAQITSCLTQNTAGTLVMWNGVDIDPTATFPTWASGDWIDILLDPSVFIAYDAPVLNLNSGYMSLLYNGPREILHCPKASNPLNYILTHESAYFSLWNTTNRRGVRIPRLDPHCIEQISHMDWSVKQTVLQDLKVSIGATTVLVRVRIRRPALPHTLCANASLLQSLYESSDTEILEHFHGAIDALAVFWQAAVLEANPYIGLMFNTPQADGTTNGVLEVYRQALGYYAMAGILANVVQFQIKALPSIVVRKPYYIASQSGYAMVFMNGRKIDSSKVTLQDLPQGKLAISIDPSIPVPTGTLFDITQVERANFYATTITNVVTGVIATTPSPYVSVYRKIPITTQPPSWDGTVLAYGYVLVSQGMTTYEITPNSSGVGYDITIGSNLDGETLCVIDDIYVANIGINLDPVLAAQAPLIFPLSGIDAQSNVVPLLNAGTFEVYINGLRLAPHLDYDFLDWKDPITGAISRRDVVIANQSYFNQMVTGNKLEIIAHSSIQACRDVSYVLGQVLRHQVTPSFWDVNLSRCFVEGVLQHNETWNTDWINVLSQPEGGVGYWDTLIHRRVFDLMSAYDPVSEYVNLQIADNVLKHIIPPPPSITVLTSQHKLYSPYLTAIIAYVINTNMAIADDPDPNMFLQQFAAFSGIKSVDTSLYNYVGPVDLNYVAVGADYANYTILSASTLRLVQRLISYTLTPSETLGEVWT